jgi:serine/threonine protein kinase
MICPSCQETNNDEAEACFTCGKALHALTQGSVLASRYVIRQSLGRGGMGYVYRAFDRMLEEDVAIKVIRAAFMREPEMGQRLRSEIRLARKVSHRNVSRIHEYGEDGNIRFLSMEFVEGAELKRLLRDGPLPDALGFEVAIQAAEGLQAVHAHGIIHRDLKPSNIMVDRRGVVRLMDFGIAKEAESEGGLTGSGQMMGTPEYMSPEQARREKVSYASDVYALGCVVYEAFVGAPPFHADTPLNTLYMHVHDPPPLAGRGGRALPERLEPLLRKALAKKAADRYPAAAFAEALREARAALGTPAGDLASAVAAAIGPVDRSASTPPAVVTTTLGSVRGKRPAWTDTTVRSSRRWRWAFAAAGGAAALTLLALSLRSPEPAGILAEPSAVASPAQAEPTPEPSPAGAVERPASPKLSPTPTAPPPSDRRLAVLPSPPRPSPATRGSVARASPAALSPTTVPTPPPTPPPTPAPTPAAPSPAAAMGMLSLVIVPAAEVTVDGVSLGTISIREMPLSAGAHVVRILHPDFKPLQRKIAIQPGATERVVLDLAEKAIRKSRNSPN